MAAIHPPVAHLSLEERVERLERIVDGVPGEDQPGMRKRVADLEQLARDVRSLLTALRWLIVVLGLWAAGNVPGFIQWLSKLLGVP